MSGENIIKQDIVDIIGQRYIDYAMSVIVDRALPNVLDGLKPVHKRLLYSMWESNNTHDRPYVKSARPVGTCMGAYHSHGDQSIYDALIGMAQPFNIRYPLIDVHGNIGSLDKDPPAAMRYCLTGDALVNTNNGLVRIKDIAEIEDDSECEIDINVQSIDKVNTASKFFNCGKHPTKKIILENGLHIEGSYNHPVLTFKKEGSRLTDIVEWKILDDIEIDDAVLIRRNKTELQSAKNKITKLEAGLLALKIDDNLMHYKEMYGDGVPSEILQSSLSVQREFLKYMFACNFSMAPDKIALVLLDGSLISDIQVMLLQFGIFSEKQGDQITITNAEDIKRFCYNIGLCNSHEENELKKALEDYSLDEDDSMYFSSNVETIEETGLNNVYSIRVDSECHSFVANGVINHNTECRLSPIGSQMLKDIEKETVDMGRNFDNTLDEPKYLPGGLFPNILANGLDGIAVGMATKMAPHNLSEIIDAVDYIIAELLEGRDADIEEILKIIKGPDFPLGGVILGTKGIRDAFLTGKGRITVRSAYDIEEGKNNSSIVITEIPYQVNKATLVDKIESLRKDSLTEIREVRDESNKDGVRVVVELKRGANPQMIVNNLLKQTQMQANFNVNNTVLVDGTPKVVNLTDMLKSYLFHSMDVIVRRSEFDRAKANKRLPIVNAILWSIQEENLDNVISTIRSSKNVEEAVNALKALSDNQLSDEQAKSIAEMRLRHLTVDNEEKYLAEKESLLATIEKLTAVIEDQEILLNLVRVELAELKDKFGDERRTKIDLDDSDINDIDLIDDETLVITYSTDKIIKSVEEDEYRSTRRGAKGVRVGDVKEDETISTILTVNSKDDLLFFTSAGYCHTIKAFRIPKTSRTARGRSINNFLNLAEGEEIISILNADLSKTDNSFALVTRKGRAKRLAFESMSTVRSSTRVISFNEEDMLVSAQVVTDNDTVLVATSKGMAIRFKTSDIRTMGRTAAGVKAINLKKDDFVIDALKVDEDATILTATENGMGKRTRASNYSVQARGGQGVITHRITKDTGNLVSAITIFDDDELFIATANGQISRTNASDISIIGRSAQGVKIIGLRGDDKVVSISRKEKIEEEGEE